MLRSFLRTDNDAAALVMRLTLAIVFFPHGAQKVLGWFGGYGPSATIQAFGKMALPPWVTVLVMVAEFAGPLLANLRGIPHVAVAFGGALSEAMHAVISESVASGVLAIESPSFQCA